MSKAKGGAGKQRAKDMWKGYRLGLALGLGMALEVAVKAEDLNELIDFLNDRIISMKEEKQ